MSTPATGATVTPTVRPATVGSATSSPPPTTWFTLPPAFAEVFAEPVADCRAQLVEVDSDAAQGFSVLVVALGRRFLIRRLVSGPGLVVVALSVELAHHCPGSGQREPLFTQEGEQGTARIAQHPEDEVVVAEVIVLEVGGLLHGQPQHHLVV